MVLPVSDNTKITIENDQETFQKLIELCNLYNHKLTEFQKILFVLANLPRHNGQVVIEDTCLTIIQDYLTDYAAVSEYAKKVMGPPETLH